ncbi:MAG TPA: GNAT family N-acetyltransferase [Blastocatellia bacterium]|nr:GNAT family N-acetyltransferase [Blastocatellia bacterium]
MKPLPRAQSPALRGYAKIETIRLRLRRFTHNDLDDFASICSDPDVMKYIGAGTPVSREELEPVFLSGYINYWDKHGFGRFAVINKERDELIGACGLRRFAYPGLDLFENNLEIVFLLKKSFWRQGFATEAAKACLTYAFDHLSAERVVAMTMRENVASRRVIEKIGMEHETDVRFLDSDCVVYVIARQAFQSDDSARRIIYSA